MMQAIHSGFMPAMFTTMHLACKYITLDVAYVKVGVRDSLAVRSVCALRKTLVLIHSPGSARANEHAQKGRV